MAFLLLLLFAAMFLPVFLGFRRQRRELARQSTMQNSLAVGDRVQTYAGLQGTIVAFDEETVDLEIAPNVVTQWTRMAIREKVVPADAETLGDTDTSDEDLASDERADEFTETESPSLSKSRDDDRPGLSN